jgi:CubicO group peptidase (beta-lactamase class C family)
MDASVPGRVLEAVQSGLLEGCVRETPLLLGALAAMPLLRRGSASLRHHVLLCAMLGFGLLCAWSVQRSAAAVWSGPVSGPTASGVVPTPFKFRDLRDPALGAPGGPARSWPAAALLIWMGGAAVLSGRWAGRFLAMLRLRGRARLVLDPDRLQLVQDAAGELGSPGRLAVLESDEVQVPMVWGPPGRFLVLPAASPVSSRGQLHMILLHELAHLRRRDTLWSTAGELLCCLVWFHPLLWLALARLRTEQEIASDDAVLRGKVRPSDYSSLLLEFARRERDSRTRLVPVLGTAASYGGAPMARRLTSILDPRTDHAGPGLVQVLGVVLVFAGLLAACGLLDPARVLARASTGPEQDAAAAGKPIDTPESLERFLEPVFLEQMKSRNVPGAVFAMVKDGKPFLLRGYGRPALDRPEPVSPDRTLFRIGSISKVFTAVAVLQLADQGLLDLNDEVNRHLQRFKLDDRFPEPVRVRHLLTHTAGFDQHGLNRHASSRESILPLARFLEENLVRVRPPGQIACYDTYGVTLAGYLLEVLSGKPFHEALRDSIFEPLGMRRSNLYVPDALRKDVAVGYEGSSELAPQSWEFMNTAPASSLNSTAADMARFMLMLLNEGELDGKRVLSRQLALDLRTQQFTNHPALPAYTYLLMEGLDHGVRALCHGGSMTGYACFMMLLPQSRVGLFLALNREDGTFINGILSPLMQRLIADAIVDPGREEAAAKQVDLSRFAGVYADSLHNHTRSELGGWMRQPFRIELDPQGRLVVGGLACTPAGPLLLRREDGLLIGFREDERGAVTHMFIRQTSYERLRSEDLAAGLPEPVRLSAEELERYVGDYELQELPDKPRVRLVLEDGRLLARLAGEPDVELVALGEHRFRDAAGFGFLVTFQVEGERVTGFRALVGGRPRTGVRLR